MANPSWSSFNTAAGLPLLRQAGFTGKVKANKFQYRSRVTPFAAAKFWFIVLTTLTVSIPQQGYPLCGFKFPTVGVYLTAGFNTAAGLPPLRRTG